MLILEGHQSPVTALAFSPDSMQLASADKSGCIWVWPPSGNGREWLRASDEPSYAVTFAPHGSLIAGCADRLMELWSDSPPAILNREISTKIVALGVLSEMLVAVGTGERGMDSPGELYLWDIAKNIARTPTFTEQHGVRFITTHPATKTVAWSNGSRRVTVWSITKPDPIRFNLKHTSPAIAFHPDGHSLVIAQQWGAVVWDVNRKQEEFSLTGHKGMVSSVAYSADGSLVISGSWDGTVKLWDAETGTERQSFQWPTGKVFAVACSPDGGRIAAAGQNGHVVVWDAE